MPTSSIPDPNDSTWMDGLADFLAQEHGVEAILLNQDERKVSIATLGNVNTDALHAKLDTVLRALDAQFGTTGLNHAAIAPPGDVPPARARHARRRRLDRKAELPHRAALLEMA